MSCPYIALLAFESVPPPAEGGAPSWTTNQVLYLLAAIVVPLLGITISISWKLVSYYKERQRQADNDKVKTEAQRDALQQTVKDLNRQINNLKSVSLKELQSKLGDITAQMGQAIAEAEQLKKDAAKSGLDAKAYQDQADKLTSDLHTLENQITEYQRALVHNNNRLKKALKLEGRIWTARALQRAPKFREQSDRQQIIISVLNLKGGVGKSTITAHLGASLVHQGCRVLMVDLDLQGSLSSFFFGTSELVQFFEGEKLLQNFLNQAAEDQKTKILDYTQPVFNGHAGLVPTTDTLAYAELNLTMRWLLQQGERDPRFLLRKALHLKSLGKNYRIVLLDCPPLMNISCINALAASDYVLVPVVPRHKAAERVPFLLRRIKEERFRKYVNHTLKVLGLVANRAWREEGLSGDQGRLWDNLAEWCKEPWGEEVNQFGTVIPDCKDVEENEARLALPEPSSRLYRVFGKLAMEIRGLLPNESLGPTTVSS